MATLLTELASREILPEIVVRRLREYIKRKNPQLSPVQCAGIFADAVNKIVGARLPELPSDRIGQFKAHLYGGAAKKETFSINGADVFKSSLRLKISDDAFINVLGAWIETMLQAPVSKEKVSQYVYKANQLLDQFPGMDIDEVAELVDASIGDIRPQKRIMSVFRVTSSSAETQGVASDAGKRTEEFCNSEEAAGNGYEAAFILPEVTAGRVKNDGNRQEGHDDWIELRSKVYGEAACESAVRKRDFLPAGIIGGAGNMLSKLRDTIRSSVKYKRAMTAGLTAAAVMCVYFTALYITAARNSGPDVYGITVPDEGVPAGGIVPAGTGGPEDGAGQENDRMTSGQPIRMKATAYDLSLESCGKDRDHPGYGITKTGTRAKAGRTIAVDPDVIPLGSTVRIIFPEEYSHMNGIYVAEDTGRLITGNRIDIFFGEDEPGSDEIYKKALEFGVQYVDVVIIDAEQASE